MIIPSGFDFAHPVLTIGVTSFGSFSVLESAAANRIDANEKHKHDNVKNRELVPVLPHVLQHPCLAGIALVAQQVWRIVPLVAILVLGCCCCHVVIA